MDKQKLNELGITKLKAIAKEIGVVGYSKYKAKDKDQLVRLILAKQVQPIKQVPIAPRKRAKKIKEQVRKVARKAGRGRRVECEVKPGCPKGYKRADLVDISKKCGIDLKREKGKGNKNMKELCEALQGVEEEDKEEEVKVEKKEKEEKKFFLDLVKQQKEEEEEEVVEGEEEKEEKIGRVPGAEYYMVGNKEFFAIKIGNVVHRDNYADISRNLKPELQLIAKYLDIEGYKKLNKKELIQVIENKLKKKEVKVEKKEKEVKEQEELA